MNCYYWLVAFVEGLGGFRGDYMLICICYWAYRASGAGRPSEAMNIRGLGPDIQFRKSHCVGEFLGVLVEGLGDIRGDFYAYLYLSLDISGK